MVSTRMLHDPLFSSLLIEGLEKEPCIEPGVVCIEREAPYWAIVQPVIMSPLRCTVSNKWVIEGTRGGFLVDSLYVVCMYITALITSCSSTNKIRLLSMVKLTPAQHWSTPAWWPMVMVTHARCDCSSPHRYQYHNTNMTPLTKYELPAFWYLCILAFIPYSNEPRVFGGIW